MQQPSNILQQYSPVAANHYFHETSGQGGRTRAGQKQKNDNAQKDAVFSHKHL